MTSPAARELAERLLNRSSEWRAHPGVAVTVTEVAAEIQRAVQPLVEALNAVDAAITPEAAAWADQLRAHALARWSPPTPNEEGA